MREVVIGVGLAVALITNVAAQTPPAADPSVAKSLESALQNFPALILGANTVAAQQGGALVPPPCPSAGARVEQRGGPTMEFLGASPENADLCRMKIGEEPLEAWYGIWGRGWAGGDTAYRAIKKILQSRTGDVVGFDTIAAPEAKWHDLIRHDGIEDIRLLGKTFKAVKLAHYREGFDGNSYRSVSTLWIDLATGLPIYGTYNHISGAPELDGQLIPAAIIPAP